MARGRLVLYSDSDPPGASRPRPTDGLTRLKAFADSGVTGALAIIPDAQFEQRKAQWEQGIASLPSDPLLPVRGIIRESAARRLLADSAAPARVDLEVTTYIAPVKTFNVAGVLRGKTVPDEYILYLAHWDSFGQCRPGEADEICNGAVDNASGSAGLLELARAFAKGPRPDRSIIFLATTAEEMGLAGSRQYARKPLAPLDRTIAAFNIDVISLHERGHTVGFVGGGLTDADSTFAALAAEQGRKLETGPLTRMVFRSSDAWSLLKAGVPAFILSGAIGSGPEGTKVFTSYLATRHHKPGDELLDDMPIGGAVEEVELLYKAGMHYGQAGTAVKFLPGSPFQR